MKRLLLTAVVVLLLFPACSLPQVAAPAPAVKAPRLDVTFRAEPSKVEQGSTTKLRWDVKGAQTVAIDHGIGTVSASGTLEISPAEVTAYNLTAVNSGGTVVSSVIINVVPFVVRTASLPPAPSTPGGSQTEIHAGALPALKAGEGYVFYKGAVMVGADNHYIVLRNNAAAKNPTWASLKAFLQADVTDRKPYIAGKFTCGDFAEMLHNNAEASGIRGALVAVELSPAGMSGGIVYHSLNAFETTDRGMVYIDNTSSSQGYYADRVVNLAEGSDYVSVAIFPQPGQMQTWPSMGRVEAIDVFQW